MGVVGVAVGIGVVGEVAVCQVAEIPLPIQNVTNLPLNGQNMVEWIVTPTETTTTTTIYNNTHFITNFPEFTNFHSFKPRNPLFLGQS